MSITTTKSDVILCNAGVNAAAVLPDGTVKSCFDENIILGNIYSGFQFRKELVQCQRPFCNFPLYSFDKRAWALAKKDPVVPPGNVNACLQWHVTWSCNLICDYCQATGLNWDDDREAKRKSAEPVRIQEMMKTLNATGMRFKISFIGGEPFRVPNMTSVCAELSRAGHEILLHTNLTLLDKDFFQRVDMQQVCWMHISLHIPALERLGLTERFIENLKRLQGTGFQKYQVTVVGYPDVLRDLDRHRTFFGKRGVEFKVIPMFGITQCDGRSLPGGYTDEERRLIDHDWNKVHFPSKWASGEAFDICESYKEE